MIQRMRRTGGRGGRLPIFLAFLSCLGPMFAMAQGVGAQESSADWRFTSLPFADLWFHGMALVDPIGPGPNPLYDPDYPSQVRRAREAAQLPGTVSRSRFQGFRDAFQRDPAFEVMHFVPLYFTQAGRVEAFSSLASLAESEEGIPRSASSRTSFGLAAVGSVLTTPGQRRVLRDFLQALEEEWNDFYGPAWQQMAAGREETAASLQKTWGDTFAPSLAPFLQDVGMEGGTAGMVPAIGVEGRIFAGSPQNPNDNVLMISTPPAQGGDRGVIFSMLRELCFPLARRVLARGGAPAGNRNEEESLAVRAAIRSGAFVLERYRPDEVRSYQRFFLSQLGVSVPAGPDADSAFEGAFPLNEGLAEALRAEVFH